MVKIIEFFHVLVVINMCHSTFGAISCLDESGGPVDSWVVLTRNGKEQAYYYWDAGAKDFKLSPYSIDQEGTSKGAVWSTLQQMYNSANSDSVSYAMYNDDRPEPDSDDADTIPFGSGDEIAHSKGVIATDTSQGFLLVHSIPKWPRYTHDKEPGPFPGKVIYAQSMLCISVSIATVDSIAQRFMINYPDVYEQHVGSKTKAQLPNFAKWVTGGVSTATNDINLIKSLAGKPFTQFAKSRKWDKELYEDLVAPKLKSDLKVETWNRDKKGYKTSSVCKGSLPHWPQYNVYSVENVKMVDGKTWKYTQDHSKWAISTKDNWVCIGDINRMCSQEERGGGTFCFQNGDAWASINKAIVKVEDCWETDPCHNPRNSCYWCPVPSSSSGGDASDEP